MDQELSMLNKNDVSEKQTQQDMKIPESIEKHKRDHWANKLDFLASLIGMNVGLGNVWRFPTLCYKNGGGAFLIPYVICFVCVGFPMYVLETSIGQYMQTTGLKCMQNFSPLFQGLGISQTLLLNYCNMYYVVIMAWAGYYMVMGWSSVLPWSHCNNTWNTPRCNDDFLARNNLSLSLNLTSDDFMNTSGTHSYLIKNVTSFSNYGNGTSLLTRVDPATEFWRYKILEISKGIDSPDGIVWQLAISLAIMWTICYLSIFYGVKYSGKVMYVIATLPYVVITILLIRGVTLPGAKQGIIYYLKPDFSRLLTGQVWIDAGTQILFTMGVGYGCLQTMGSYNKYKHNYFRDCLIVCVTNCSTSLYAGFAIFSILGFMSHQQGAHIDTVAEKGPGLAFIAFPKAVAQMPLAPLWASVFFLMILFLGIGSQIPSIESVISTVLDIFPTLRRRWKRVLFVSCYCLITYCIALTMVTRGGVYVFQLFDYYAVSGFCLLWVVFWESICVVYVFGGRRMNDAIEIMLGHRINYWFWFCWAIMAPSFCLGIFIFQIATFKHLVYDDTYIYPAWANNFGLFVLAMSSMIWLPVGAAVSLYKSQGTCKQRLKQATTPRLRPEQISPKWNLENIGQIMSARTKIKNKEEKLLISTKT